MHDLVLLARGINKAREFDQIKFDSLGSFETFVNVVHDTLREPTALLETSRDFPWQAVTTLITILVAVGGWVVAALISRSNFQDKVRDEARILITKSIGEYQLWLKEMVATTAAIPQAHAELQVGLMEIGGKLAIEPRGRLWAFHLAEHEIIFPQTREIAKQLNKRDHDIAVQLNLAVSGNNGFDAGRLRALAEMQNIVLNEVRCYLQNVSLGKLFRRKVLPASFDDRRSFLRIDRSTGQLQLDTDALTTYLQGLEPGRRV